MDEPIKPRVTDDFDADVRDCVERSIRVLERYVRRVRGPVVRVPARLARGRRLGQGPSVRREDSARRGRGAGAAEATRGASARSGAQEDGRGRSPMRTLVIIPCRDLEAEVGDVVRGVTALGLGLDVVVVNDGSTDGTSAAAEAAGRPRSRARGQPRQGRRSQDRVRYAIEQKGTTPSSRWTATASTTRRRYLTSSRRSRRATRTS